ncbi:MAG: glycosyltransferase, partial [Flavobacteriaceae bacterium]|nr:glycosyltransferase [Flavobacteriaceae bacterium]
MRKINGIVDISICSLGFSGMPQDTRRNYSALRKIKSINVDALIIPDESVPKIKSRLLRTNRFKQKLLSARQLLKLERKSVVASVVDAATNKLNQKNRLFWSVIKGGWFFSLFKYRFKMEVDFSGSEYDDYFWRKYFSKTLPVADKKLVVDESIFRVSRLTKPILIFKSLLGLGVKLDTSDYDFIIFPEPTIIMPSRGTIKLVRFHDAIPLTHPHFINDPVSVVNSYRAIKHCVDNDAVFICNSCESRSVLNDLFPGKKIKTIVIPCSIGATNAIRNAVFDLSSIIRKYISYESVMNEGLKNKDRMKVLNSCSKVSEDGYIVTVANIDPKKNQQMLISAWDRYRSQYGSDMKLIMVSSIGWSEGPVLEKMKNHFMSGNLVHLNKVSHFDLTALMSNAKAFVFPSIVEGFGLGNLEAARCGCPVVTSDIGAHRYVM